MHAMTRQSHVQPGERIDSSICTHRGCKHLSKAAMAVSYQLCATIGHARHMHVNHQLSWQLSLLQADCPPHCLCTHSMQLVWRQKSRCATG